MQDRLEISPPPALKVCRRLKWVSCQKVLGQLIYLRVYKRPEEVVCLDIFPLDVYDKCISIHVLMHIFI